MTRKFEEATHRPESKLSYPSQPSPSALADLHAAKERLRRALALQGGTLLLGCGVQERLRQRLAQAGGAKRRLEDRVLDVAADQRVVVAQTVAVKLAAGWYGRRQQRAPNPRALRSLWRGERQMPAEPARERLVEPRRPIRRQQHDAIVALDELQQDINDRDVVFVL